MKKNNCVKKGLTLGLAVCLCASTGISAFAVYSPEENGPGSDFVLYNEAGANIGLDENTENAEVGDYSEEDYVNAGAYIISNSPSTDQVYDSGIYYETTSFEYGDGVYVIIQDEDSPEKFYTLIKSTQDLEVGEPYIYREDEMGKGLLDDKYTSTHMAENYLDSDYSYVSYDMSGGKLAAQEAELDEDGIPLSSQEEEGFSYIYLVAETAADYYQRLANEEAGYEEKANSEERAYMPVNNQNSSGEAFNNWANITDEDPRDYNDRITRVGGTEGNSNTRDYSYSGQNVIVAKFAITVTEGTALLAYSDSTDFDADTDYSITEGEIEIGVGETVPLYFHTQYTNTWGRDGYANADITYTIGDDSIISYVGRVDPEEGAEEEAESYVLTGLSEGTTTLTATVDDSEGKYAGGAEITLTVTVK